MKIALGCDHGGFDAKTAVAKVLTERGVEFNDYGCFDKNSCDYPDFAEAAAEAVRNGECDCGILVCTTGNGISIAANKVNGIRCANCINCESATLARAHNNINIMAFGAKFVAAEQIAPMVNAFLDTPFEGGRHARRVDKIMAIEKKYSK